MPSSQAARFETSNTNQMPPQPRRRVILLGASNLVRSLSIVVETVRLICGEPVEIMAAMGHGRSYGQDSSVLGRKISGIFPCALWRDLQTRGPLPTFALVTDIGNDLLYGVTIERILEWVVGCLERLDGVGATTIITQLPLGVVNHISEARYRFFRALFFPKCTINLSLIQALAIELNAGLVQIAALRKIPAIPVSEAWYGFDPIHLKRSIRSSAWPTIFAHWSHEEPPPITPRGSLRRWLYLQRLEPLERTIFGCAQHCRQPSGVLSDGTTISLY
jgi:hypothetical protein